MAEILFPSYTSKPRWRFAVPMSYIVGKGWRSGTLKIMFIAISLE